MATRRTFLQATVPILTTAVSVPGAEAAGTEVDFPVCTMPKPTGALITHALFETTSPEARRFAGEMRLCEAKLTGIEEDITGFWYRSTGYSALKQRPEELYAMAGLTLPTSALCLEVASRDLRMRVSLRTDHRVLPDHSWRHSIQGSAALVDKLAGTLRTGGDNWPQAVARVMRGLSLQDFEGCSKATEVTTAGRLERASLEQGVDHVTSWIIAPVRSVQQDVIGVS